jgi:hypothetical protein
MTLGGSTSTTPFTHGAGRFHGCEHMHARTFTYVAVELEHMRYQHRRRKLSPSVLTLKGARGQRKSESSQLITDRLIEVVREA